MVQSEIWTHLVLSTKENSPRLEGNIKEITKQALRDFISQIPNNQGTLCVLSDHVHLLSKLPPEISLMELILQIQTFIGQRLRQEGITPSLKWSSIYHAHSVSLNRLEQEKSLISRQEIKHKNISLKEELKFLGL